MTPDEIAQIDWDNKTSLVTLVQVVSGIVISIISLVVALRIWTRSVVLGRLFLDDGLIIAATVSTIIFCSILIAGTHFGIGQHVWNLNLTTFFQQISRSVQFLFVVNIFYAIAIGLTKLSIMASYYRIWPHSAGMRWMIYTTAVITIGLTITSVPATVFQCHPISAAWDFSLPQTGCYNFVNFLYASTAINISTDLVLCIMPLPYLWKLSLPRRQKLMISTLFFIGGFAGIASIFRISYMHLLEAGKIDVTYNVVTSLVFVSAECAIGIVCVSLPSLRPLFVHGFFKPKSSAMGSGSRYPQSCGPSSLTVTSLSDRKSNGQNEVELVPGNSSWSKLCDAEAQLHSCT